MKTTMMSGKALVRCVTFDVTNTLLKVAGSVGQQYSEIAARFEYRLDPGIVNQSFRKHFKQLNLDLPGYGVQAGVSSRDWWRRMVELVCRDNEAAGHASRSTPPALIARLADEIYDEFARAKYWRKYPGSDAVLEALRARQITLGVVSNFDERLHGLLTELGWSRHFAFVHIPLNSAGFYKPRAEIFDHAFASSGASSRAQMVHVGDDYELDYLGARAAGFGALLLKHGANEAQLAALARDNVECVADLNALLKRLLMKSTTDKSSL